MKAWILGIVTCIAAGCGITQEQLDARFGKERRWAEQERKQFTDAVNMRLAEVQAEVTETLEKLQRRMSDLRRDARDLATRVKSTESALTTIQTTAIALQQLRQDSEGRLADMKELHDTFNANVNTLDAKIRSAQDKYREVIRKQIQLLKEQYTNFSNLLRELEQGGG